MNDAPPTAVSVAEFRGALARLGAPRRYIVAVSGGPDSMALARLAAADAAAGIAEIIAVTVDHGLRPESRAEAEQVGRWCRAANVEHRILSWEGPKPASGVQAAARRARYRLLAEFAAAEGYSAILTGHTAGDQAETVFMRLARGAGPQGLAAMEARTAIAAGAGAPVELLRPLLEVSRARIVATLQAFAQDSIADPSNDDPGFERIRTRALLAALAEQGLLTPEALCRTAARMRAAADRLAAIENEAFVSAAGVFSPHGWAALDLRETPPPGLIARLIRAVSGADHLPSEETAAEALATVGQGGSASLGGAILRPARGRLFVCREPAAVFGRAGVGPLPPLALAPGQRDLWDGRFIVANCGEAPIAIAPLAAATAIETVALAAPGAPAWAFAAAPGLAGEAGVAERPAVGARGVEARSLAEERFAARLVRFS